MSVRRINPIGSEADDIVRVVRRLEEAIRALHQVADLLPLIIAAEKQPRPAGEAGGEAAENPDQAPTVEISKDTEKVADERGAGPAAPATDAGKGG